MLSKLEGVKYVKVVREIDYNTIRGTRRARIFNYNITDGGVHVATFVPHGMNRNFHLTDLSGKSVHVPEMIRMYIAVKKDDFDWVYGRAKEANAVPSIEAINSRQKADAEWKAVQEKETRKQAKASQMYDIIKDLCPERAKSIIDYVEGV